MSILRAILICWWLMLPVTGILAAAPRYCVVCDKNLPETAKVFILNADTPLIKYYIDTGAIRPDQCLVQKDPDPSGHIPVGTYIYLCEECNGTKTTCSLCGLPVRSGSISTGDGRVICRREASDVVLDAETARQVFETATREARNVAGIDFGLKDTAVTVQIFDVNDWAATKEGGAEVLHKIGHSKSRRIDENHLAHYVGLYSGQRRSEVICTCVHEYMHLWINENLGLRQIEQNSAEAVCELLAYKVAVARQDVYQQKRILENPYTQGRIKELIEVERERGFYYILDWIKNGLTRTINETPPVQLVKKTNTPPSIIAKLTPQPQADPLPVKPATLMLKGMFSKRGARLAVLNDGVTVAKGESAILHLNGRRVTVKCLDVLTDSVVLQLEGSTNSITLEME